MNKREWLLLCSFAILSILLLNCVSAAEENSSEGSFDKAYSCLKNQVNEKIDSTLSTDEIALALLALGYDGDMQSKLQVKLDNLKDENNACWPKNGCTLKDTSLVLLAYNNLGKDTSEIKNWILNKSIAPSDLVWYLQIDTENKSKCDIKYDGSSKSVNIDENKIITGSPGSCFRLSANAYWLQMDSKCFGKEIEVSCDEAFVVSTFYKRGTSSASTYYLTSSTDSAAAKSTANAKVESICFKQGTTCNYEGNLWAALALDKVDTSVKDRVLPYLITLAPENEKYLPSSFLYTLTDYNEYLTELATKQSRQGYWKLSETSRLYYDTAVALIKLGTVDSEQASLAETYLLDASVQTNQGCWNGNSIRDTAFLLYVLDPKTPKYVSGSKSCSDYSSSGYSCITSTACNQLEGIQQPYSCSSFGTICCSKSSGDDQPCSDKGGVKCSSSERCTGETVSALGTTACCLDGNCELKQDTSEQLSSCEREGNTCRLSCLGGEQESSFDCPVETGGICCEYTGKTGSNAWWIWLLIILIILLVLAIIFRDQVKMWWFRIKNKFSKSPASAQQPRRPPFPPAAGMNMNRPTIPFRPSRIVPGMMPPRGSMSPGTNRPFPKDKELDDTLKKLKDMSKK
ncbi:MAG: hypothetical protein Q8L27_04325 [archaeon]|nr:hypothetical protein [archaeon]